MATFKDFIQPISNFIKIAEAKKKEIQECIDEYNTKNTDEKEQKEEEQKEKEQKEREQKEEEQKEEEQKEKEQKEREQKEKEQKEKEQKEKEQKEKEQKEEEQKEEIKNFLEILNNLSDAYGKFIKVLTPVVKEAASFIAAETPANSGPRNKDAEALIQRDTAHINSVSYKQRFYAITSDAFLDLQDAFNKNSGTKGLENSGLMEKCSSFQWDKAVNSEANLMMKKLGKIVKEL